MARLAGAAVCVIALSLLLGGCSETASDLERPEIVWPEGKPSGMLEDSEWGQVYRQAEIELSLARAYGDFSDPDLIAAIGYDLAEHFAATSYSYEPELKSAIDTHATYASKGTIVAIDQQPESESATIVVCGGASSSLNASRALTYTWNFARTSPDTFIADYELWNDVSICGSIAVQPGLWAEPFDPANFDPEAIKMPLPREYYIDLGVISE